MTKARETEALNGRAVIVTESTVLRPCIRTQASPGFTHVW